MLIKYPILIYQEENICVTVTKENFTSQRQSITRRVIRTLDTAIQL